jgi:Cellulase (glycosyl hydrolase family 5)
MSRTAPLILAVCALVAALVPAAAQASKSQTMTFEAPVDLANPATRTQAFDEIQSFGIKSIRIVMLWQTVAPAPTSRVKPDFDATDPASYDWSGYDPQVDGAIARGWSVLLTVSGPVPRWATNGARDNLTRPKPKEFQAFMTAVARHYGTRIARWSIWNEPNQPQFLLPQYSAVKHTPLSPRIYRNLFFAAQRGLAAGGLPNAQVLIGETSPRGTSHVVAPLTFLRGMLCLDARYHKVGHCAPVHAAGYAHHAYTTAAGPLFKPKQPNDVTIGVISRLITALNRAARAGAIDAHLPISLTEFGIQSTPDPIVGVSLAKQSDYRAIAERLAYEQPRIAAFSQYLLRDDPPVPGVPRAERYPGFESGLRTNAGRAKPALTGFRLPLVAFRRGSRVSLWGLVRPAGGPTTVSVEYRSGGAFKTLFTTTTDARGYFTRNTTFRAGRRYRLTWTQPDGRTIHGTTTSVYRH